VVLGFLLLLTPGEHPVAAQDLPSVRVVAEEAKVLERPELISGTVSVVTAGTILELLDRQDRWFWVLVPRDKDGMQPAGWIQASRVEMATPATPRVSLSTLHGEFDSPSKSKLADRSKERQEKEERDQARKAADEERERARKAADEERERARKAVDDARAAARLAEAARQVEQARRKYEGLAGKADDAR
jgi:hypothetical protein